MSEANRLEESIHNNECEKTALAPLLQEVFTAYEQLYVHHNLLLECPQDQLMVNAVPELIVQALDKLMDNAASFCPKRGNIVLALTCVDEQAELSVINDGPPLAEELHSRLFDSMISLREGSSNEVHLGLGLYIVRLIADFHGGSVRAENLENGCGVSFSITLPLSQNLGTS